MKKSKDWYPHGRHARLDFAKRWLSVFQEPVEGQGTKKKWQAWGIPEKTFNDFKAACSAAENALDAVITSGSRGGTLNAAAQTTFDELERQSRDIKRRYVFSPPLSPADYESLDVREKDYTRTPKPAPKHAVSVNPSNPEPHAVQLGMVPGLEDGEDFSFNIRLGILSPDGSIPERSTTAPYYITKVPVIPEDLPGQFSRRRKKETFTFTAADAGKTAYFCVCYQNSGGETGPWGPMIPAIIT